jgi:hypothetical protein
MANRLGMYLIPFMPLVRLTGHRALSGHQSLNLSKDLQHQLELFVAEDVDLMSSARPRRDCTGGICTPRCGTLSSKAWSCS